MNSHYVGRRFLRVLHSVCSGALGVGGALLLCAAPAAALEVEPGNYIPFPTGTNLLFAYYQYLSSGRYVSSDGKKVPDSEFTADVGVIRENYYGDIAGVPYCTHVILPFGSIESARVAGVPANIRDGLGDLIAGATIWPIHSAGAFGTKVGVSQFFIFPTGTFNPNGVSLGSGAVSSNPEMGVVQGLGPGFLLSTILDAQFQADHSGGGHQFSRRSSYQIQAMLGYEVSTKSTVWFGYSGQFGGAAYKDGVDTGQRSRVDEVRLYGETFLTRTWHLNLMIATDVSAEGGFQKDVYGQIRLVKAFWGPTPTK